MGAYHHLRFSDGATYTRVQTLPGAFWSERPKIYADLLYLPDGQLFYVKTGYVGAARVRIPGVPSEHCVLLTNECGSALEAHRKAQTPN
jgi:hypothetical protein